MITLKIEKVEVVPFNSKQERIDMVYIRLVGKAKEHSIGRKSSQFLIDLQNSYLLPKSVTSMEDTKVLKVLRKLKGGTVSGELSFHKKGDTYTIDANHPAIINPNHVLYGKVVVGTPMEAKEDGWRITTGFLDLEVSDRAMEAEYNADAYAERKVALDAFLQVASTGTSTTKKEVEITDFDLNDEVKAAAVGEQK